MNLKKYDQESILIVLNDPPYGTERSYNGLRLALSLSKRDGIQLKVFLMGDAVGCGKSAQNTPHGYYNLERMRKALATSGVLIGACGSCLDARGISDQDLISGVHRSSMDEMTEWTIESKRAIVF
ncbi:MAG: DsrE/DsrF/TusD sulfur relay family protein [Candidatus Zixiibacteriota bacterium]